MLSWRFLGGVDFLELIDRYIVSDKTPFHQVLDAWMQRSRVGISSQRMYSLFRFRKSTAPRNLQVIVDDDYSKYLFDGFVGGVDFLKRINRYIALDKNALDQVLDAWVQRSRESGVEVAAVHINGSKHQNFADFTLLAPDITQVPASPLFLNSTEFPILLRDVPFSTFVSVMFHSQPLSWWAALFSRGNMQKKNNSQHLKDVFLKAYARIWP